LRRFPKAAEGYRLDDVVVYARDAQGKAATLELQVKKGITFAPGDKIFHEVIGQIVSNEVTTPVCLSAILAATPG
jgi:hypothetical protein